MEIYFFVVLALIIGCIVVSLLLSIKATEKETVQVEGIVVNPYEDDVVELIDKVVTNVLTNKTGVNVPTVKYIFDGKVYIERASTGAKNVQIGQKINISVNPNNPKEFTLTEEKAQRILANKLLIVFVIIITIFAIFKIFSQL